MNKEIETIIEQYNMECNGYAHFNKDNFLNHHSLPCYIPENAEDTSDVFSRDDLREEVKTWLEREDTKEYILEIYDGVMPDIDDKFFEDWVVSLYEGLEWTFPSTQLENYLM
jgi:hypothetical protein